MEKIYDVIKRAKEGDEIAFKDLVLYTKNDLYKIAKSRLSNDEEIKDVLQDTMLKVFKNIKYLNNIESFKIWITKILINECNRHYNHRKRNSEIIEKEKMYISTNSLDSFTDDIGNAISFKNKLRKLRKNEQNIIILFYGCNFSCPEISKILNMNENTVKSNLKRAKIKLKKMYLEGEKYE